MRTVIYTDPKGRFYWINEAESDEAHLAVCRVIRFDGRLDHTSLQERRDLTPHAIVEMNDGVIEGWERLNATVEDGNKGA